MSEDRYRITRGLIWLYFALLLFEGVLRKWILPSLSNPILIIRDPLVVLIYLSAFGDGSLSLRNGWNLAIALLSIASFAASFLAETVSLPVMLYGYRTNFLHL